MPAPKPMPGVGGPPISSMSPSYRPPPQIVSFAPIASSLNSNVVRV